MPDVMCTGGAVLTVRPVPVRARDGVPYEVTLELLLDGAPFGQVGERCGGLLADAARRLAGVSVGTLEAGGAALSPYLTRDRELFALRTRDPDDPPGVGALRALLDPVRTWTGRAWSTRVQVRLEAWADDGRGVSALLDLEQARALVDGVLGEAAGDGSGPLTTL